MILVHQVQPVLIEKEYAQAASLIAKELGIMKIDGTKE